MKFQLTYNTIMFLSFTIYIYISVNECVYTYTYIYIYSFYTRALAYFRSEVSPYMLWRKKIFYDENYEKMFLFSFSLFSWIFFLGSFSFRAADFIRNYARSSQINLYLCNLTKRPTFSDKIIRTRSYWIFLSFQWRFYRSWI